MEVSYNINEMFMEVSYNINEIFMEVSYIYLSNTIKTNTINTFQ
jgi:hypothetical protein